MAKSTSSGSSFKIGFGTRKKGVANKSHNKNDRKENNYRGQGR